MEQDSSVKELENLFIEFKKIPIPKLNGPVNVLDDTDVDMFEEDSYLAGLVDSFLASGHIDVDAIFIDTSIDSRINIALDVYKEYQEILQNFKEYRQKMLELAKTLSRDSGVPIRDKKIGTATIKR